MTPSHLAHFPPACERMHSWGTWRIPKFRTNAVMSSLPFKWVYKLASPGQAEGDPRALMQVCKEARASLQKQHQNKFLPSRFQSSGAVWSWVSLRAIVFSCVVGGARNWPLLHLSNIPRVLRRDLEGPLAQRVLSLRITPQCIYWGMSTSGVSGQLQLIY